MSAPRDHDETREIPRLRPTRRAGAAGPTLADALREHALPPLPWAVWIGRQAADQVDQAHRLGVVHGRVSLAAFTVVDTPLGEEVVLDVDPTAPRAPTPLKPFHVASDLWGLGEVLYQLITGAPPPFDPLGERVPGPTREDGLRIPDVVSGIVLRLLAHAPQERPSASEVGFALARAERELAATGEPGLSWERGSLVLERYRLLCDMRNRASTLRFVAADERDLVPCRVVRLAAGVSEPSRPLIQREWERLRAIADPRLERLVELRGDDGELVAVTAAPDAASLTSKVLERGPLPLLDARVVVADVARGLAALHATGTHFGGLLANDVVVVGDPPTGAVIVNLCDAIADRIAQATDVRLHQVGSVLSAFAPEVLKGGRSSPRSDLYDLGLFAYLLLAGRGPFFDAKGGIDLVKAHLLRTPPHLTDVQGVFGDVVAELLEKDPARRQPNAAFVAQVFEVRD